MAIHPTGRIVRDDRGLELLLERRLDGAASELWPWLTVPARLKRWVAEPKSPTVTVLEPQLRVRLSGGSGSGDFTIEIALAEVAERTTLYLSQRVDGSVQAGIAGPTWEWSLDRLVAAWYGLPDPKLSDYRLPQRPHYERLAMDGDPVGWPSV